MNLTIQNSWYTEIVQNILKPEANIVFIVDKPQILEFPPIKEEIEKDYPILKHFKSELELRLLLKKKKHKIIIIFKSKKKIPYDLMSKFIIFNIRHMLKEVFNKLDCEEILKFPIEIYQNIFENFNKMKDSLFEKMSKADTQKFIKNIVFDDKVQKRNYVKDIKLKIKNLIKNDTKNIDWGKVSIELGELLYYIDNFNINDDIIELKSELNDKFLKYIKEEYENLIYDTKSHINSNLINLIFGEDKKRNAIICFDCMGFEEWYVIKEFLDSKNGLDFKVGYSFSILPSETKYSSSAIFAGMVPKDIKELEIINQIHWKNEERLFKYALSTQYEIDKSEIYFKRCLKSNDIDFSFDNFKDYTAIGLVFSLIDDITHSRRRMNKKLLLKTIKIELEDSNLDDLIRNLLKQDFNIYFVSDHGNIFSYGNGINVSRDLFDSKAKRYLISNEKILLSEFKREIRDSLLIQFKNIIGNDFLLLLFSNVMFGGKNESTLTHGGISIEEVVVPFIKVMKK